MARTATEAFAAAKDVAKSGTTEWDQNCKRFCRTQYGVPSDGTRTAREAWAKTKLRGKGPAPFGALLWWTGGSAGHVVISDGKGGAIGNWARDGGRVHLLPVATISQMMGGPPAGWSRDIDGVEVIPAPKPAPHPVTTTTEQSIDVTPAWKTYVVQSGDTVGEIAARVGTTVAALVRLNKLPDADRITVGQRLKLPKEK